MITNNMHFKKLIGYIDTHENETNRSGIYLVNQPLVGLINDLEDYLTRKYKISRQALQRIVIIERNQQN